MTLSGNYQMIPKLYLCDRLGNRSGVITGDVLAGRASYDPDRAIQWDFTAKLRVAGDFAPYIDFVAPELTLIYDDGETITEPLGVYATALPKSTSTPQQTIVQLDGRDLSWLLAQDAYDEGYAVAAGTNYITAVSDILASAGLTKTSLAPTSKTLASAKAWPPGTTKKQVVSDLLGAISYYPLYALRDGTLTSREQPELKSITPATTYATPATGRVRVVRTIDLEPQEDRLCNKVIVMNGDPASATITSTLVNDNPASPVSTAALGVTICQVVQISDLASQADADAVARRHIEKGAIAYRKLKLQTTPDPSRNPHEVYTLAIANAAGAVATGQWAVGGFSIGFTPADGPMTHDLSQLVPWEKVS